MPAVKADDAGSYKVVIESPLGNLETACDLVVEGFCPLVFVYFSILLYEVVHVSSAQGFTYYISFNKAPASPIKCAVIGGGRAVFWL